MTPSNPIRIRTARDSEFRDCEAILRSLPDWFGIEEAILEYAESVRKMPTFVVKSDDETLGFLTVNRHFPTSAEIHVMGIRVEYHAQGIGRQLVERVESWLREDGCLYLQVKTLSPSRPNDSYARTRGFYEAMGFQPLEEMKQLWDPANPCLIYVKRL